MAEKTIPEKNNNYNSGVKREITRNADSYVTPRTDIYDVEDGLNVVVDLPGVEKDGLNVQIEDNVLTIEGKIALQDEKDYLLREYEPSNFFRQFELTDAIAQDKISAELKNGVLNLSLPKAEALKPRAIEVKFS